MSGSKKRDWIVGIVLHSPLTEIEVPPPEGQPGGLGEKLENILVRFSLRVFSAVSLPFSELLEAGLRYLFDNTAEQMAPVIVPILKRLEEIDYLPEDLKRPIRELQSTEPVTLTAIALGLIMATIGALVTGMVGPIQRLVSQETDNLVRSNRMMIGDAYASFWRGAISREEFIELCKDNGWPDTLIEAWGEILQSRVGLEDLSQAFLRDIISEVDFRQELTKRGYSSDSIDQIIKLLEVIPPLPDIISMAVREAFTPSVVEEFQLESDLPEEFVKWAKKRGLSDRWVKAYWASHWRLPSLTMGFEMLHRRIITPQQMEMLIKAQDISPFWRDKLIKLSYNVYTRVDTRRMYAVGVLDREGVYESYLDQGYTAERAEHLTDFTVALSNEKERDLTKSEVLWGYREGYFNNEELSQLLGEIGYDDAEIAYFANRVNYERWKSLLKEVTATTKKLFVTHQIDETEVYNQLGQLNLPAEQINRYIRLWSIEKERKTTRPTKTDLTKFYVNDIIDKSTFIEEMRGHGYSEKYIQWYVRSLES